MTAGSCCCQSLQQAATAALSAQALLLCLCTQAAGIRFFGMRNEQAAGYAAAAAGRA